MFDVSIEGVKVLDNYDIVRKVGAFTATTETFTTAVSDDMLNLYFSALPADGGVDNAKISAIEVYSLGTGPNPAPVANAGPDQSLTLPTSTTTLSGAGTVASGRTIAAYAWSQVGAGPAAVSFSSKTVANPTLSGLTAAGTYTFALVVTDNTGASSAADQVLVTVNPAAGQAVVSFELINADTEQPIRSLVAGDVLNLATLPTKNLNVRATTSPATVGSVVFALTGAQTHNTTESTTPYSLFGTVNGNYNAWTPPLGNYSLTARPYTGSKGKGTPGTALTLAFSVTNKAALQGPPATARPDSSTLTLAAQLAARRTDRAAVYPNPSATGRFHLRLPAAFAGELHYVLVSALGTTIAHGELALPTTPFAARLLDFDFSREMSATGVYYLLLSSPHVQSKLKLLKE